MPTTMEKERNDKEIIIIIIIIIILLLLLLLKKIKKIKIKIIKNKGRVIGIYFMLLVTSGTEPEVRVHNAF